MAPSELTEEERAWLISDTALQTADDGESLGVDSDGRSTSWDPLTLQRQMHVLESFHVDVAHRFSDVLSRAMKRLVDVQLAGVQAVHYSQFAYGLPDPTCYFVIQAKPLATPLALNWSPTIAFPLLDYVLGGGKRPCTFPDRPATDLEQRLIRRIVVQLLDELHDAWEPLLAVSFTIERFEAQAQRVRLVAPAETVIVLEFDVTLAHHQGPMALCLPYRTVRKMLDKLVVGEERR